MHVLPSYVVTDAILVASTAPENDAAAWAAGTAYGVGARVMLTSGLHRVYERIVAGTTPASPAVDTSNWMDVGPTNRWAMFSQAMGPRTVQAAGPLTVSLQLGSFSDLVLLGVSGTSVTLSGAATRTVSVPMEAVQGQGCTVVIQGLASAGGTLTVAINGPGSVACGLLAVGTFWELGSTSSETSLELVDYSVKKFDAWGNAVVVPRAGAKRLNASFVAPLTSLDACDRVLSALRSRSVMWMGGAWLDASIVYGFARSWSLRREAKQVAGSLSIQGLAIAL